MARYATTIEIAGIEYTGCAGLILDGDEFGDPIKGSTDWGLDSTPHNQRFDTQFKGVQFGINVAVEDDGAIEIAKVNQTVDAIKLAQNTTGYFIVEYIDEIYTVNVRAIVDYTQKWYTTGRFSDGFVKGVTFRFIVWQAIDVHLMALA